MSETLEKERGRTAENMKVMPKVMGKDERRGRWAESRAPQDLRCRQLDRWEENQERGVLEAGRKRFVEEEGWGV